MALLRCPVLTLFVLQTLQKYTREYLFQKFRVDYQQQQQQQSLSHHMSSGMSTHSHAPSLTHVARPILAIDTAQHGPMRRPPSLSSARNMNLGPDMRSGPIIRTAQDTSSSNMSVKSSGPGASKFLSTHLTRLGLEIITLNFGLPTRGVTCSDPSLFPGSSRQRTKKITVACNFCRCEFRLGPPADDSAILLTSCSST